MTMLTVLQVPGMPVGMYGMPAVPQQQGVMMAGAAAGGYMYTPAQQPQQPFQQVQLPLLLVRSLSTVCVTYRFLFWSTSEVSKNLDAVVLFNMGPIIVNTSIRPEENNKLVQGVDVRVGGRKCPAPLVEWVGITEYTKGAVKLTVSSYKSWLK